MDGNVLTDLQSIGSQTKPQDILGQKYGLDGVCCPVRIGSSPKFMLTAGTLVFGGVLSSVGSFSPHACQAGDVDLTD